MIVKKLKRKDDPNQLLLLRNEVYINMMLKTAKKAEDQDGKENISIIESYYGEVLNSEIKKRSKSFLQDKFDVKVQKLLEIDNDVPCNLLFFNYYQTSITLLKYINGYIKDIEGFSNQKLLIDILNGLNYLHQLGICHHDLKPENIFKLYILSVHEVVSKNS